jgi:hypothetical protein
MPIYNYECSCGKSKELVARVSERVERLPCECGEWMQQIIVSPQIEVFPSGYWEDIDVNPVYISSKRQLVEECTKRGVYAKGYMENYSPRERAIRRGF